jgi:hypothetical protein
LFTQTEQKYIILKFSGGYGLTVSSDAPRQIAKSIEAKIKQHKKWLENKD